jgi:putative hydrolase of the HAD superfamily
MKYDLFLFDLDDTLLDFRESERLSFSMALQSLGLKENLASLYEQYQIENRALWTLFEQAQTTKEHLKVERFRRIFKKNAIEINPEVASDRYLDALPGTVVLIDQAVETCQWLSGHGEIGILTNGMSATQTLRIQNSKLAPYLSFVSVSEDCGFAKPDVRFFEHSIKMAKKFSKSTAIMIGDRLETDILGAQAFGLDSCWFNPHQVKHQSEFIPTYEIKHLSELREVLKK